MQHSTARICLLFVCVQSCFYGSTQTYCIPNFSPSCSNSITLVTDGNTMQASGCLAGYASYADTFHSDCYGTFNLIFETALSSGTRKLTFWVDKNFNFDFDTPFETIASILLPAGSGQMVSLSMPYLAYGTDYRIRVALSHNEYEYVSPCGGSLSTDEMEDYTIHTYSPVMWYLDYDHDGFLGDSLSASCPPGNPYFWHNYPPSGYPTIDCNDSSAIVWQSSLLYIDADGDGYDNGSSIQCYGLLPSGYSPTSNGTDCNDNNPSIHPGAVELLCDGIDNNCNSVIDPLPGGLTVAALSSTTATAVWTSPGPGASYDFEKRPVGNAAFDPGWTTSNLSWSMNNMTPTTQYEWHVRVNCGTTHGNWTALQPFTTTANSTCGSVPTIQATTNISATSAKVHWAAIAPAPTYYNIRYKPSSSSTWLTIQGAGTAMIRNLTGLTLGTAYQWQIRSKCGTSSPYTFSAWSTVGSFTTASVRLGNFAAAENQLTIFPNPATSNVTIQISSEEDFGGTIVVTDMTGRVLLSQNAEVISGENNFDLNIADLLSGMYIVCIRDASDACRMNSTLSKVE